MLGDTSSPTEAMSHHVKTIQHRIATLAEYHAKEGLSSIHHHLDKWWLAEAYRELKPNKAPGTDGVSIQPHEALDHWFVQEIQPRLKGAAQMVRFADDAVLCFQSREEAQQVLEELGKRMTEYGLKLHPEKTKLVDFRPPERGQSKGHGSLNFLGFCFYWARTRKGRAIVKLKTAKEEEQQEKALTALLTADTEEE